MDLSLNKEPSTLLPPSIKQVLKACDDIYNSTIASNNEFCPYKYLHVKSIQEARVKLGFTPGSNSTIVKGKKLWLEQNQHLLVTGKSSDEKSDDPMLGIIKKIRADLSLEADEKIKLAEDSIRDEKESLISEIENLSVQLKNLNDNYKLTTDTLNKAKDEIASVKDINEKQFVTLKISDGQKISLEKTNNELRDQIDVLYRQYKNDSSARDGDYQNLVATINESEQKRQEQLESHVKQLSLALESAQARHINQIRDKDDALMVRNIEIGNFKLANERLERELKDVADSLNLLAKENKALLSKKSRQEGESSALQDVIKNLNTQLIETNRDNAVLGAKLKSLEIKLAETEPNE